MLIGFAFSSIGMSQQPAETDMRHMIELSKPGENHKVLNELVGEWRFTGKHFSDDPNQKPLEFRGTFTRKPVWGGRYFLTETTGEKLKMPWSDGPEVPYKDMSLEGYDNAKERFVRAMIDNHWDTGILSSEGTYDRIRNTITFVGEVESEPGIRVKTRMVLKIIGRDQYIEEGYEDHNGHEVKVTELDYTRTNVN